MTELRQRMVNDMILRGMAQKTRTAYTQAVAGLAKFYRRAPDQIIHEEVQAYLLHLIQGASTCSTVNADGESLSRFAANSNSR